MICTLLKVNDVESEFDVDLEVYLQWKQPELVKDGAPDQFQKYDTAKGAKVLKPEIVLIAFKTSELIEDTFYVNEATGDVCCLLNWLVTFREPMELQKKLSELQKIANSYKGFKADRVTKALSVHR